MSTAWDDARQQVAGDELARSWDWMPNAAEVAALERLREAIDAYLVTREQWRLAAVRHAEGQGYTAADVAGDEQLHHLARKEVRDLIAHAREVDA